MSRFLTVEEITSVAEEIPAVAEEIPAVADVFGLSVQEVFGTSFQDVFSVVHEAGGSILSAFGPGGVALAKGLGDVEGRAGLINTIESQQAKAQAQQVAQGRDALRVVIDADRAYATQQAAALTMAQVARSSTGPVSDAASSRIRSAQAQADLAAQAEDRAAATLPDGQKPERLKAAKVGLGDAVAKLQAKPTDTYAKALVDAWQQIVAKASPPPAPPPGPVVTKQSGGNFLTRRNSIIPAPNWVVGLGATGVVVTLIAVVEAFSTGKSK